MASRNDRRLGFVAGAARGAAAIPARAAAQVARDRLEDVADAMLASPGTLRAVDRILAGPLPEEIVRSAVRNRVLERMVSELAAGGALDELVSGALESRQSQALVDRVVASEEMQRVLRDVLTSPEVRHALVDQTSGFSEEVVGGLRGRAARLDEHTDRRAVRAEWDEGSRLQCQRGLVALDVSASGCRLSGSGAPPPAGARIRLDISTTTYGESQWLSAEVMRVETSAFGRYLLGLRFNLESADDYSRVLAWRDASLRR